MTKTLTKKTVIYLSKIIKIVSSVEDVLFLSGVSEPIYVDILINDVSILNSGEIITLDEISPTFYLTKNYLVKPLDEIKVELNYPSGTTWTSIKVDIIASQIVS